MNNCMYCNKPLDNPKAKFCSPSHKMSFRRGTKYSEEDVTVIKKTVTDNRNKPEITVTQVRTSDKVLQFTTEPIEKRIEIYKEAHPDSTFIPNWIRNGYNSKEEALQAAIEAVEGSKSVKNSGL